MKQQKNKYYFKMLNIFFLQTVYDKIMALIKKIYRLTMRHFMFLCFLLVTFGIGFYVIFFHDEDDNQLTYFNEYDSVITFWSSDYHIR